VQFINTDPYPLGSVWRLTFFKIDKACSRAITTEGCASDLLPWWHLLDNNSEFSGAHIRHNEDENYSNTTKYKQAESTNQTTGKINPKEFLMSVDCWATGENDFFDLSVGRISLVKDTGQHEVWFSITTNTRATQPTSDHHTYGRLEHRLGIALVQMKTSGYWSENEKTGSIN
ncbi:hypothetical protein CU098_006616, partial [Rhizopus stolonifer]